MWQKLLISHLKTRAPDPWEFLRFITIALDEQKTPLPEILIDLIKQANKEVK